MTAAAVLGLIALAFLFWSQRQSATTAIAVSSNPAPMGMSMTARDPKWPVQITTHAGLDMHPAISPQGDAIAFASDRSGSLELYVRGLGGNSVETPLTTDGGHNVQPAWSPDG